MAAPERGLPVRTPEWPAGPGRDPRPETVPAGRRAGLDRRRRPRRRSPRWSVLRSPAGPAGLAGSCWSPGGQSRTAGSSRHPSGRFRRSWPGRHSGPRVGRAPQGHPDPPRPAVRSPDRIPVPDGDRRSGAAGLPTAGLRIAAGRPGPMPVGPRSKRPGPWDRPGRWAGWARRRAARSQSRHLRRSPARRRSGRSGWRSRGRTAGRATSRSRPRPRAGDPDRAPSADDPRRALPAGHPGWPPTGEPGRALRAGHPGPVPPTPPRGAAPGPTPTPNQPQIWRRLRLAAGRRKCRHPFRPAPQQRQRPHRSPRDPHQPRPATPLRRVLRRPPPPQPWHHPRPQPVASPPPAPDPDSSFPPGRW
jgi:hypothetical protein